jgi:hypothetical protein
MTKIKSNATYDNPLRITYQVLAATIATAGVKLAQVGPEGMRGRVETMEALVTTATTTTASIVSVGSAADDDAYASLTVAVGAADTFANDPDDGVTALLPADTLFEIASDGGSDAGAANLSVTIAWF